jgi:Flp pilus assembly CpaF family ATPase
MMAAITREPGFSSDRLVVLQDRLELHCETAPNKVMWLVDELSMRQAVKYALRMYIQRLVVGEVRDAAMYDVIDGSNTGHDGGLLSLHCNGPADAIDRAKELCRESGFKLGRKSVERAVQTIVWMGHGRRVLDVVSSRHGRFSNDDRRPRECGCRAFQDCGN